MKKIKAKRGELVRQAAIELLETGSYLFTITSDNENLQCIKEIATVTLTSILQILTQSIETVDK
jgi:hypothetical protein